MAKVSPNSIQNLDEDWGHDQNTDLPFSGESVQAFIKSYLRKVTGAAFFDTATATLHFFASDEERDAFVDGQSQAVPIFSVPMNFSGELYRVHISNNNGSTNLNVATNSGTLPLSASYVVQKKSITDTSWTDTVTRCYATVFIDRGLTGNYSAITERTLYNSGATISLDIFPYLANGANHVRIQFEAEDGTVTSALTYTITLAELYVEPFNNVWYVPVLQNDESTHFLGGFKIAGAGYKYLHISIYDSAGEKAVQDITVNIGTTNSWATTPYRYPIPANSDIFNLNTGVYKVRVYVSTSAIDSEAIEYNIMYVKTVDASTAKLVCINDVPDKVYNYSTANLCNYSVYNGGSSYADLEWTYMEKDGETVVHSETKPLTNKETSTLQTLSYEVRWDDITGDGYYIGFEITNGAASASADISLDNSSVFPPTSDYDFYLLPSQRENGESTTARQKIVNAATGDALPATWTDVDFINGIDGWTEDDNGRKCLRIPAGTKVVFPYTSFNLLSGDNQTVEICYKAANVADYDENIITLSPNPTTAGFQGIRIKPTNITVHSSADTDAQNDSKQGTNLCDEEAVHFVLTVNPYYNGNNKLVKGFVNGCKNFMFSYTDRGQWQNFNPALTIGSDKTDIFVYFVRHYPIALSDAAVQVNYISSLSSVDERNEVDAKFGSVMDSGGTEIDYEAVKDNGYNFFVITMEQGNGVPSAANDWSRTTKGVSTLEFHYGDHPEWDWKMPGLVTRGQGTTSMNYYRWNIRWDIPENTPVSYLSARTRAGGRYYYEWESPVTASKVRFDGTNHPRVARITAKINSASSMQSHKIGATKAYTELHDAIGLENEAQHDANPRPVVSVYEYPAFGFEYDPGTDTYTFVGLFTIGPDKGDNPTFGFDTVKDTLISLEGTDHNQPLATFSYPYLDGTGTGDVNYFYTQEGIAINKGDGTYLTGLEIGNCHGKEIDKEKGAGDEADVRSILHDEFKPAYDIVWHNSTLIFPVALDDATYGGNDAAAVLANIRANKAAFIATQYARDKRLTYGDMQFWIEGEYKLYWYNPVTADFVEGDSLGSPTGATLDAQNENYKAARRASFKASAENWWDIQDALFHFDFCLMFGASDNFAKNSYPYIMALHENGGRWKWRQDDLDTIFDIDNMGQDTKPYFIEFMDDNNGVPFFAGGKSVFWNLIYECYWEDYTSTVTGVSTRGGRTLGKNIIAQMTTLSRSNNDYDGFINYVGRCFWNNAQNYFPESAYNADAVFMYEDAWLHGRTEALPQALGNHYSGERFWVRRRAVYMLSLFRTGPFGNYSDIYLGRIDFRPDAINYAPTPMMWLYPALLTGAGGVVSGERTEPGDPCDLAYTGVLGETTFYMQATDFLASLGDLKGLHLASGYVDVLGVEGKKLVDFKIGDATKVNVTTNVPGLSFSDTKCLEEIDARNAESITAISGIADCARLRTLKLIGTKVTTVDIASGSKLETLSLPSTIQRVALTGLHHLSSITDDGYAAVTTVIVEDCPLIGAFALLEDVQEDSSVLHTIRVVWPGIYEDNTGGVLDTLVALDEGNYQGISATGDPTPKPFIDGTVDISGVSSQVIFPVWLNVTADTAYGQDKRKATIGNFNTGLGVIYDPDDTRFVGFLKESGGAKIKTSDGKYVTL